MCGIAGIVDSRLDSVVREKIIQKINNTQARRGPDDQGVYSVAGATLGHRRLSIIDLSAAGHQPLRYSGKKSVYDISFNGEIYNFAELKKELQGAGFLFSTKTDTEVICALYEAYGVAAFSKMRGIFALAIWDEKQNQLVLARDQYGVKPLYYFQDAKLFVFASSVKALVASGAFPAQENADARIDFLLFGSVSEPYTTLKNVFSLPAGHVGIWDGTSLKVKRYYDLFEAFLKSNGSAVGFKEAVCGVRDRVNEAVRLNLVSDAPLGIFLSGGLDSSVLSAFAAQNRTSPVTTLSITFDEQRFNEKPYQDLVAERIKSDHREVRLRKNDFFDSIGSIFDVMDQPTVDGVNTYFISKAAHDAGLKVVLSGLGSDELFMGYSHFRRAHSVFFLQSLFQPIRTLLSGAGTVGSGKYKKASLLRENGWAARYGLFRGLFIPREVADMLGCSVGAVRDVLKKRGEEIEEATDGRLGELEAEQALSYLELTLYMRNQLLRDTDIMSMSHSVEARVPFLETGLVEYVASLPPEIKLEGAYNKQLLIDAAGNSVPHEVFERKKMGFTFPFAEWLKGAPVDLLGDNPEIKKLFGQFRSGSLHWSRFWAGAVFKKYFS